MEKNSIPVFLSSDDNYVPYMATLMVSIMDNTQSNIDFYIVDAGISEFHKKQIVSLQEKWKFGLEFINSEPYRHLFKMPATPTGHITKASSDRFLIPHMKPNINRGIILDVDMIALGDIKKLWDIDLENKLLAAVPAFCWTSLADVERHCSKTGLSRNHIYFNMGTLLVDFKKWRQENLLSTLSNTTIKFDTKCFPWWDEILLNLALQDNKYKILDPKFNMMIFHQAYYKFDKPKQQAELVEGYCKLPQNYKIDEIIFSHFAMRLGKPWNEINYYYHPVNKWDQIPNFKDFWHYIKMTPFYDGEYITFMNKIISNNQINAKKELVDYTTHITQYKKYKKKYKKYKILTILTFGLIKRFNNQKKRYRKILKELKGSMK